MMLIPSTIGRHVRRSLESRTTARDLARFLEPGAYGTAGHVAFRLDPRSIAFGRDLLHEKHPEAGSGKRWLSQSAAVLLPFVIRERRDTDGDEFEARFRGSVLTFGRNGAVQVFSLRKGRVLRLHPRRAGFADAQRARMALSEHIPAPRVFEVDEARGSVEEELVVGTRLSHPDNEGRVATVMASLLGRRWEALQAMGPTGELVSGSQLATRLDAWFDPVRPRTGWSPDVCAGLEDLTIPETWSHGDVCVKNVVMRSGGEPVLVDWEFCGVHSAIFDFLSWPLVEALDRGSDEALVRRLRGATTDLLRACAGYLGVSFHEDRIADYFRFVLLERLYRRVLRDDARPDPDVVGNHVALARRLRALAGATQAHDDD